MTREKHSHRRGRVRELALTIGACAGVLCIVIAAAGLFLGIKPLVFRSGSMEPEISTGALAFSRSTPADEIAVGDVVSVINTQGTRITHRVDSIAPQAAGVVLTLKGDANAEADIETYYVTTVDRVLFSMNKLGYLVSWASGPIGVFLGGVLAGILLMIAFRPGGPRPNRPEPPTGESIETTNRHVISSPSDTPSRATRSGTLVKTTIAGATLVSLSLGIAQTTGTAAAFQDTARAQSTFTAASVIAPRVPSATCATTGGLFGLLTTVTLTWTAPSGTGPYTYKVIVRKNDTPTSTVTVDNISSLTTTIAVGLFGLLADGAYTAEIYTKVGTQISTAFFPVPISVASLVGTKCVKEGAQTVPAGFAARLAPAAAPETTSTTTAAPTTSSAGETTTSTSTSATESSPTPTTPPETTTTATTTNETTATQTTTLPTTTTTTTTLPTTSTTTAVVPVGDPSDSGTYFAAIVTGESGRFASITDSSGTEIFRTAVGLDDELHWLTGADELWILGSSGPRKVSKIAGQWTSTSPTGELPAEIAALVSK
ncbi:signal peptidase I [Rhodococcus globerulus]|uniref:signal peptidase I n=1 Tax=Rhodococcus globerulus TaxID=33008 RepID=UPI003016D200